MNTPEIPPPPRVPDMRISGHGFRLQLPGVLVTAIVAALASGGMTVAVQKDPVPADVRALTMAVEGLSSKVTNLETQQKAFLDRQNKAETEASLRAIELARIQGRLDSVTPR